MFMYLLYLKKCPVIAQFTVTLMSFKVFNVSIVFIELKYKLQRKKIVKNTQWNKVIHAKRIKIK